MGELKPHRSRDSAIALPANVNLEGKGLNGFLLDWYQTEPRGVNAKPRRQVLAEFFTSMLVLSAKFKYRPAAGVENYLYWIKGEWMLSLVAPHEWSDEKRTGFAGTCVLQRDMTWTIAPSDLVGEENPVSDAIRRFYDAFAETLDADVTLEEILPFYVGKMPYYQRVFANALSRSIRGTVTLGEQRSLKCKDWQTLLPRLDRALLSHEV